MQGLRRPLRDLDAEVQDHAAVGDAFHHHHLMLDDEDCEILALEAKAKSDSGGQAVLVF